MNCMRSLTLAAGLTALLATTGAAAQSNPDEVLVNVNGETITQRQFDDYVDQRTQGQGANLPQEARGQLIQELINVTLLAQKAREEGLDEQPDVAARLTNVQATTLAQAAVAQLHGASSSVSDEEVQTFYDEQFGKADTSAREYKARHILVSDKAKAEALIGQLSEGADFAKLAEENSEGPTASKGGDLGWFSPDAMVPPFAEAVQAMEPGSVTDEPVQTRFGWHVIKLEDTREATPPTLEEVRPQIVNAIARGRVEDHLRNLRTSGNIDYKADWTRPGQEQEQEQE